MVKLEEENTRMSRKIQALKDSMLFKMIKPFRNAWARLKNALIRVKRYGSAREVVRKLESKAAEKNASRLHGLMSFPDEEGRRRQSERKFGKEHVFSILVPLYNTPERFLREMIESVEAQTYGKWQLCLADGSDENHPEVGELVAEYIEADRKKNSGVSRISYRKLEKNGGISENTNACIEMATGDYIGLFDHDDVLHPSLLYLYMLEIEKSGADFLYCDEATFKGDSIDNMVTLHFKPDFSIDNLRANNYICHFSCFTRALLDEAGYFRKQFDGSQDHDMILRLTSRAGKIAHIPHILYYWRSHEGSTAADISTKEYAINAAKGAVAASLEADGFRNFGIESTRAFPTIFEIRYEILREDMISVIIPTNDHVEDLKRCVESIYTRSSYENYEILVVENGSREQETFDYYSIVEESFKNLRVLRYNRKEGEAFNFSALINFGAAAARGEYLLLLNNDTEVITRDWMENMLMYAQREDVAAVGAKLYYDDMSIQHAGIVLGLGAHRTAGHTHYRMSHENLGYMGRLCYAQDVSAVTGACLMVSRRKFQEAGGFDESFAVALNDVDFCLKLREKGYLNVFTPFAELFHYESRSRGDDTDGSSKERADRYDVEAARFREKWKDTLAKGDPYYNPNFSLDHSNYTLKAAPPGLED